MYQNGRLEQSIHDHGQGYNDQPHDGYDENGRPIAGVGKTQVKAAGFTLADRLQKPGE